MNKRHYVVRMVSGYYEAKNKKDAVKFLHDEEFAEDIIYTRSENGNYYHNRVNVVMTKYF